MEKQDNSQMLTFSGHLDVLRKIIIRLVVVTLSISLIIFCIKDFVFDVILSPSSSNFITYRIIEQILSIFGSSFRFNDFCVELISTDLSAQFMTHVSTSLYIGLLLSLPYILFELFRFISPALYEDEKRYSKWIVIIVYVLFLIGLLMSYYIIFPISFRFLGTYSVAEVVKSTITIKSYISTFISLSLVIGLVFQLPVITYILGKLGVITAKMLSHYRKHALLILTFVAAIITPPDILSCILVTLPLYLLFEISIRVLRRVKMSS